MKKEKAIDCLPCPFCGHEPTQVLLGEKSYITCENYDCACGPGTFAHIEPDEPRQAWNTRDNGWISVDERLPEHGRVLIYSPCYEGVDNDMMGTRIVSAQFVRIMKDATHWKPLPSPPEDK